MLYNITDYVTATVIYIFVFKPTLSEKNEYMVFNNLEHTQMSRFITFLEQEKVTNKHFSVEQCNIDQIINGNAISKTNADLNEIEPESGDSKPKRAKIEQQPHTYYDYIRSYYNENRSYKIVRLPFTKKLYQKILASGSIRATTFEQKDYFDIFKYVFLHLDDNVELLSEMCESIQENPTEFLRLFENDSDEKARSNSFHNFTTDCTCCNSERCIETFWESVNTYIICRLKLNQKYIAMVYGENSRECGVSLNKELENFNIGFFFQCLQVEYDTLRENIAEFHKAFQNRPRNTTLTIIMRVFRPIDELKPAISGKYSLNDDITELLQHEFFKQKYIEKVAIKVESDKLNRNPVKNKGDYPYDYVTYLKFTIDFKNNEIQPIRDMKVCISDDIYAINSTKFANLSRFTIQNVKFAQTLTFSEKWKNFGLYNFEGNPEKTIHVRSGREKLIIKETIGRFDLSGTAGFSKVLLSKDSEFSFKKRQTSTMSSLCLVQLRIDTPITIDRNIVCVVIAEIECNDIITLEITSCHDNIEIFDSKGIFKFEGIFCAQLNFTKNTFLGIEKIHNIPRMCFTLYCCAINDAVQLPDYYNTIELKEININNNFKINNGCSILRIFCCRGKIVIPEGTHLKVLKIVFDPIKYNELIIEGMPDVNELILQDLCCDYSVITHILNQLGNVMFLKIVCSDEQKVNTLSFEAYLNKQYVSSPYFENSSHKNQQNEDEIILDDVSSSQIIHRIVQNFLNAFHKCKLISRIHGLTYIGVLMSNHDLQQYSMHAANLKALDAGIEYLTNNSFEYMPQRIEFLNLCDSCTPDENLLSKFENLKNFDKLKVIVVDAVFVANVTNFQFLPESTEVLMFKDFGWGDRSQIEKEITKLKLRKLYVFKEVEEGTKVDEQVINENLRKILETLGHYVEFENLESFVVVDRKEHYEIDPVSFNPINQYRRMLNMRIGENQ
ncbi:putative LRR containing protein [Trachipleistophora hominis]|uniref:Putative LRR containing protein n=1 Tax=Trachipleistophora hominis TaxID=72359 RepID=L7JTE1_TRAHO|nr:putative LRR containing protein [Trachipleistophora hominis]